MAMANSSYGYNWCHEIYETTVKDERLFMYVFGK